MFTHIQIHEIGIVRRLAGAVTGSLLALTVYSAYHDIGNVVKAMAQSATTPVAEINGDTYEAKVARIKSFADTLKQSDSASE